MNSTCRQRASLVFVAVAALATGVANGQNLLSNGNFEESAGMPGWSLEETVTDMPGALINSAQQQDFANQPMATAGEFGLWLLPFNGNTGAYLDQNRMTNAILSQSVPGAVGQEYTWSGWSRFEPNYSGGVDFLDELSPSGAIESPTQSIWELAFLDATSSVIGTPVTLDLRTEQTFDNEWRQHTLMGTAPEGTANVRVTAAAYDMVANVDPMQSGFYDNFSLTTAGAPGNELLANNLLNEPPPEFPSWSVTELPEGANTVAPATFANNPGTGGSSGMWLRGFVEGDAIVSQTVSGTAGGNYTLSAWSAFEQFYTGGLPGTETETFIELAFLDASEELIGEALVLNLLDAGQTNAPGPVGMNPEAWRQFSLDGTAPEGTAFVRASAGALGMVPGTENPQSAFFDDLSLTLAMAGLAGDFNGNGSVENADLTLLLNNWGNAVPPTPEGWVGQPLTAPAVDNDELTALLNNWGTSLGLGGGAAVPEPTGWLLAMVGLAAGVLLRRRW